MVSDSVRFLSPARTVLVVESGGITNSCKPGLFRQSGSGHQGVYSTLASVVRALDVPFRSSSKATCATLIEPVT